MEFNYLKQILAGSITTIFFYPIGSTHTYPTSVTRSRRNRIIQNLLFAIFSSRIISTIEKN